MPNYRIIIIIAITLIGGWLLISSPRQISAADNDFILAWSSNSYVPADYEGRALPSLGSQITVAVMPAKKTLNSDTLTYRWLLDNELIGWANGQGKSSFRFAASHQDGAPHQIESQVLNADGNQLLWRGFLTVKLVRAQILIREAGAGYSAQEVLTTATGRDLKLFARPLFFHIKNPSEINFSWQFDGQTLASPDQKNLDQLTLKIPAGNLAATLTKSLKSTINHKTDPRQSATVNLNIEIK